jgi:hypothetical protein
MQKMQQAERGNFKKATAVKDSYVYLTKATNQYMEPIPYYYDSINRNAIVVKPKQPLVDWVNSMEPDSPSETGMIKEGTVYLVKEKDSNEALEKWLQKNFDSIFQNELNNWYTDEDSWPQKRSYKQFTEWFDFEIHSMILDIEEDGIVKD